MWATHWLCMVASIHWIDISGVAIIAHFKISHGSVASVIRQGVDNGVARTAIGAIGKWVLIVAVLRVINVVKTISANTHVGRNSHICMFVSSGMAINNTKLVK